MNLKTSLYGKLAAALALAVLLWAPGASSAKELTVSLAGPEKVLMCRAGETCLARLKVTVKESFHINSARPIDPNLIATRLSLKAPKGVSLAAAGYPKPHQVDIPALGGKASVYDGRFTIVAKMAVEKGAAPGRRVIGASLFYQACDNQMCFMPTTTKAEFEIEVK